jgi:hypothetical protein
MVDWLLLIVWSIAIISGIPALLAYSGAIETAFDFGRIHGVFARLGGVFILVHIFQHAKQIRSYFKFEMIRMR